MDVGQCGGIMEAKKIAGIDEAPGHTGLLGGDLWWRIALAALASTMFNRIDRRVTPVGKSHIGPGSTSSAA